MIGGVTSIGVPGQVRGSSGCCIIKIVVSEREGADNLVNKASLKTNLKYLPKDVKLSSGGPDRTLIVRFL